MYTWYKNAVGNANTPMGSNIAYFKNKYGILKVNGLSKNITNLVSEPNLMTEQIIVIQHLQDLLDIKNNACTLDHWRIEGGPWPPTQNWLRCSKLEVADQQGVVNSRS